MSATDLAMQGGVSPQTASAHLAALREAGLVTADKRGRNRYYALSGPAVAQAIEALQVLTGDGAQPRHRMGLRHEPMRIARTCYDHLAGMLGVAMTEAMVKGKYLEPCGRDFRVKPAGADFLSRLGVKVAEARAQHRRFARQCLDWSERRPHLAGSLGAAIAARCFELGWLRRAPQSRAVTITRAGRAGLRNVFSIALCV